MKKIAIICAIIGVLIVVSWFVIRQTGLLNTYRLTSTSNEPNLTIGEVFFASNVSKPKRFDFICYKYNGQLIIHRVCGIGGDKVQLKDGKLFLNDTLVKQDFDIKAEYAVDEKTFSQLVEKKIINREEGYLRPDKLFQFSCSMISAQQEGISGLRIIQDKSFPNPDLKNFWGKDYNIDNFGPIVVPKDHYFVLGDNRNNAADSRYTGFITPEQYVAKMIGKL